MTSNQGPGKAEGGEEKDDKSDDGKSGDADDESDDSDPTLGFDDGRPKNPKYRHEDRMFVNMGVKAIIQEL